MQLVFDIETDALKATKIWCIVAVNTETDRIYSFNPDQIDEGIKLLQTADTLIGHNIIGFDIPIIKKLTGVNLYENTTIIDTLVLSRLFNPVREGGHSLAAWGYKLNFPKGTPPEDFTIYNDDMLTYCIQDVQVNKKLFHQLRTESKGFSKESIQLEHETTKVLSVQRDSGFKFDEKNAMFLLSSLNKRKKEVEEEVQKTFKPKWVDEKLVTPYIKKDGDLSKRGLTKEEYEKFNGISSKDIKPFMRKKLQHFNLGSRKQIGEYLQDFGWKPKRFTPTGQPIVDEGTLKKIKHIHEANLIAEFLLLQKRIAQIASWVDALEEDKRVHGFVMSTGTITGRMSHRFPNMAQVPNVHNPYGEECRACWIVDEGYKLIGIDASQLELRMLAHYMDDKEYINEIINGDIHSTNQKLAGLESRDQAKTFIYALIYGAGDPKIGGIVKGNRAEGKRLRERFLSRTPSFKSLRRRVDRASQKGHLKGIDGRKISIRHQHAALNSLLQGGGAIVMKRGLVILNNKLQQNGFDYKFVANIHDEWQIEVREDQAHEVGKLAVESIRETADYYSMRCPLDAEYKVGGNWSETH
jgi:DNA polymerase-1